MTLLGPGCQASSPAPPKAGSAAPEPGLRMEADKKESEQPAAPAGGQTGSPVVGTLLPADELDRAERELEGALAGKDAQGEPLSSGDRCTVVCKALGSMRRSADEICKLEPARCDAARSRVSKAELRAKDACPACAAPT